MLQINLIAPPLYVITTNTLERADGLTKLNEILEQIKKVIESNGGVFTVKMAVSLTVSLEFFARLPLFPRWFGIPGKHGFGFCRFRFHPRSRCGPLTNSMILSTPTA